MRSNIIPFPNPKAIKIHSHKRTLCAMTTTSVVCTYISDQPYFYIEEDYSDEDDFDDYNGNCVPDFNVVERDLSSTEFYNLCQAILEPIGYRRCPYGLRIFDLTTCE